MRKDYYLVLRLAPEATQEQIRSAYRRLALELHPDLTGLGSDRFLELKEAYDVLSDPVLRQSYDRKAQEIPIHRIEPMRAPETIVQRRHRGEPLMTDWPTGKLDDISLFGSYESFSPSLDEVFERLRSNFTLLTRPKAERLESLNVEVPLSPQQAFAGGEVCILIPARQACPACDGHGGIGPYECSHCEGHGAVTGEYPVRVSYPAGLQGEYLVRIPLNRFGIENFYLTVQFRPTASMW